jgi:hypothetical protein
MKAKLARTLHDLPAMIILGLIAAIVMHPAFQALLHHIRN